MAKVGKPNQCDHCNGKELKLRRQVTGSGVAQVAWRCIECDRWAQKPPVWIGHLSLSDYLKQFGSVIDDIPLVADYSDQQACIICGEPGEWHHFAPQALSLAFGDDWLKWPCAPLCVRHHRLWHDTVTPNLRRIPER